VALPRLVAWRRVDQNGLGVAQFFEEGARGELGCSAQEVVVAKRRTWAVSFDVRLSPSWETQSIAASVLAEGSPGGDLYLQREEVGWKRMQRQRVGLRPIGLGDCVDVDIVATAATNTFPIRRLGLEVGEAKTIPVAWIDVPSLRVRRLEQTYRRVAEDAYEYSTATYGPARLTVDEDGIVIDYEGFAERIR
jgi:hypothetical protein